MDFVNLRMYKFFRNCILILIISILIYIFEDSTCYNSSQLVTIFILSALSIFLFFRDKSTAHNGHFRIFRPSILLLLGMSIIAYQNSIDLLVGNYDKNAEVFLHPNLINKGVSYASIAIVAYILGYTNTSVPFKTNYTKNDKSPLNFLLVLCTIFTLLFLTSIDHDFITGQTYVESGSIDSSHTNNSEIFLNICNAAIIIQYAINNIGRKVSFRLFIGGMPKLFLVLLAVYLSLRLLSGAREPIIRTLLTLLFAYVYANKEQPFKNVIIVICIIATSFILSLISIGRGVVTDDISKKYETGLTVYNARQSFSPSTQELAQSQFCDMIALNQFEVKDKEHLYGAIQGRYLSVLFVPNRILQQVWPVETHMQGSAYYITTIERGSKSEIGLGTTIQSDFYVDFGLIGMILCLIFIGVIYKKVDLSLYSNLGARHTLLAVTLIISISASAFYLSRSAFIPSLRLPMYTFILLYINRMIHIKPV